MSKFADLEEQLRVSKLENASMKAVVAAAIAWNNEMPALSPIEAKLVTAVVDYLNHAKKLEGSR